ncbi:uncharacterized protein LOC122503004 [Leptopilina heterotoma]|uniref:uncharacterized protein LOC122503004 n=1 Tax=Leptopilina heterotoma TaxID=63436 RepID=UPI001CA9B569|nr:uncharacterized protein LOC122503004 [Leptopilina heterotoma]
MAQQLWIQKLKNKFHLNKFRGPQVEIITNISNGNDGLYVMPTGGGRSLCFQFPTYLENYDDNGAHTTNKRTAIIISLLLALIEDQDNYLQKLHGCTFRDSYVSLQYLKTYFSRIQICGFSATITRDEIPILQTTLELDQNCMVLFADLYRANLKYSLNFNIKSKEKRGGEIIRLMRTKYNDGESGIIHCGKIEDTELYCKLLRDNGYSCERYHAKLSKQDKNEIFLQLKENRIQVLCATIALGMGIDKSDTRFVINTTVSNSLANYCQETGRVGRDNIPGDCILFYHYEDIFTKMKLFIGVYTYSREIKDKYIKEMLLLLGYCENQQQCRYKFIIKHFDPLAEKSLDPNWQCHNCDICKKIFLADKHRIDVSKLATEMKSLIINLENTNVPRNNRLNINGFVPFLLGKTTTTNRLPHFCQNVNFGCLTSWKDGQIWRLFATLLGNGVLSLDFSPNPMERNSINTDHSVMITAANNHHAQPPVLVEQQQGHYANVTHAIHFILTKNELDYFKKKTPKVLSSLCYKELSAMGSELSVNKYNEQTNAVRNHRRLRTLAKVLPETMEEYQQCCSNNPQNTIQPYDNALLNVTRQYKALSIIGERPQQPQPPEAPPAIPAAAAAATPILAEQTLTTPTAPTAPLTLTTLTTPTTPTTAAPTTPSATAAPTTPTTLSATAAPTTPTTPAAAAPATTRVPIAIQFAMQLFVVLERLPIAGPSRPRHQPESVKSLKICPGRRRILEFSNSDDSSDDKDDEEEEYDDEEEDGEEKDDDDEEEEEEEEHQ